MITHETINGNLQIITWTFKNFADPDTEAEFGTWEVHGYDQDNNEYYGLCEADAFLPEQYHDVVSYVEPLPSDSVTIK